MGFPVYDYRTDLRNVLVTPQIRSRFLRVEPGPMPDPHTHDLGHEIFLVLSGRAEFEIDGEKAEVGPGQMCVALIDQPHAVRALGDEPVTMYLSVTPHIQPTHTTWTEDGQRMPFRFAPSANYDVDYGEARPLGDAAVGELAGAAESLARRGGGRVRRPERVPGTHLRQGHRRRRPSDSRGDTRPRVGASSSRSSSKPTAVADLWNELAPRADGDRLARRGRPARPEEER